MTSWTPAIKNTATWETQSELGTLAYLLTDALDYILVGSAEDETLILWGDIVWANQAKS